MVYIEQKMSTTKSNSKNDICWECQKLNKIYIYKDNLRSQILIPGNTFLVFYSHSYMTVTLEHIFPYYKKLLDTLYADFDAKIDNYVCKIVVNIGNVNPHVPSTMCTFFGGIDHFCILSFKFPWQE